MKKTVYQFIEDLNNATTLEGVDIVILDANKADLKTLDFAYFGAFAWEKKNEIKGVNYELPPSTVLAKAIYKMDSKEEFDTYLSSPREIGIPQNPFEALMERAAMSHIIDQKREREGWAKPEPAEVKP